MTNLFQTLECAPLAEERSNLTDTLVAISFVTFLTVTFEVFTGGLFMTVTIGYTGYTSIFIDCLKENNALKSFQTTTFNRASIL